MNFKRLIPLFLLFQINFLFGQDILYAGAQNGLIVRNAPHQDSVRIGKFLYAEKLTLLKRVGEVFYITDNGNSIRGRWYEVSGYSEELKHIQGYVFSGFLTREKLKRYSYKKIRLGDYELAISESTQNEFESTPSVETVQSSWLSKKECITRGLVSIKSNHDITVKLADNTSLKLKNHNDEQFSGYGLIKYDSLREFYIFYESWLEAGHYTLINAKNSQYIHAYGEVAESANQDVIAVFSDDIGAGWTGNGIQVLEMQDSIVKLFDFDPSRTINENWGPVGVKWISENQILIECITHNVAGGYITIYKKLEFNKL